MEKKFTAAQTAAYILAGALLLGAVWRIRGTHGWGGGWGLYTVGMVFLFYVYAVFARRSNASFLHCILTSLAAMLTAPAWGTLVNQPSGFFDSAQGVRETAACSPWSGVFMLLCLGFGMVPLYLFMVSRLFSDKPYPVWKYITVFALFFLVSYLCEATVSHGIVRLVQPESVAAVEKGLRSGGVQGSAYAAYMKHFADIGWAKKIPFGRNYFSEIEVVSRAVAAFATAVVLRFAFKDRAGGRIVFWGGAAFSVGITLANVFFVLKNKLTVQAHPWLSGAWSFWEFFTGFFAGLLLMLLLFRVHKIFPDTGIQDKLLPRIPQRVSDILLCAFVFVFGFGVSLLRPVALRMEESDILPVVVYAVGGVLIALFSGLMLTGKLPKMWRRDPNALAAQLTIVLFLVHAAYYFFVGFGECVPKILENDAVRTLMLAACPLFFAVFLPAQKQKKKI